MSEPIQDGGPAFPEASSGPYPNGEIVHGRSGMTLRDWFAGQALQGLLACAGTNGADRAFAGWAYDYADAMIAKRGVAK